MSLPAIPGQSFKVPVINRLTAEACTKIPLYKILHKPKTTPFNIRVVTGKVAWGPESKGLVLVFSGGAGIVCKLLYIAPDI